MQVFQELKPFDYEQGMIYCNRFNQTMHNDFLDVTLKIRVGVPFLKDDYLGPFSLSSRLQLRDIKKCAGIY